MRKALLIAALLTLAVAFGSTGAVVAQTPDSPPPSAPPTPPVTAPTEDDQAAATFGPTSPLVLRYRSKIPPVVHVQLSDSAGMWTIYNDGKHLRIARGLQGQPFVSFSCLRSEMLQVASLTAQLTIPRKIQLVELLARLGEKPVEPPHVGAPLPQPRVTSIEHRTLEIGRLSAKIRWLFHKVEIAPNQMMKLFWGAQIRVLTLYINHYRAALLEDIWSNVDAELDRGAVYMAPGRPLDMFISVVAMHIIYRDDDKPAYSVLVDWLKRRLMAELSSIPDYPPAVGAVRKQAVENRLAVIQAMATQLQ